MQIHYFQRYHKKEDVATANTMLLLSRLYSYSSDKFFRFLKLEYFPDLFNPEIIFTLQEKSEDSIPDATITQESFKIVVETKMSDWFYEDQLLRHLNSFSDEKYKVMLTLAPELMEEGKKADFEEKLKAYNEKQIHPVIHINTTFEAMSNAISDILDDRDYEMQDVLNDYLNYCYTDGLISVSDSWKYLRMQLAGTTFDFNVSAGVYYDDVTRGFRAHDFLGLYRDKSVRALGKVVACITAVETENGVKYNTEFGDLTDERKETIAKAMSDGDSHGYDLRRNEHRYFFVNKFYEMDFKKVTPRAPMGTRIFDLTKVLGTEDIPETEELARRLTEETWN